MPVLHGNLQISVKVSDAIVRHVEDMLTEEKLDKIGARLEGIIRGFMLPIQTSHLCCLAV